MRPIFLRRATRRRLTLGAMLPALLLASACGFAALAIWGLS